MVLNASLLMLPCRHDDLLDDYHILKNWEYDVWINSPQSVTERRRKFIRFSSGHSSASIWSCNDLDSSVDVDLVDVKSDNGSESLVEKEVFVSCSEQRATDKLKDRLLNRLRSISCMACGAINDDNVQSNNDSRVEETRIHRVKVQYFRRRMKKLSGLFTGEDSGKFLHENMYPTLARDEWYFFTSRELKYPNGSRPNRAAGDGYWKATVADQRIQQRQEVIGFKKTLVLTTGRPPTERRRIGSCTSTPFDRDPLVMMPTTTCSQTTACCVGYERKRTAVIQPNLPTQNVEVPQTNQARPQQIGLAIQPNLGGQFENPMNCVPHSQQNHFENQESSLEPFS
ncbi:hypothetical protein F511_14346 [Dorcoceras hygrometricum]|uniref:NAC domain-containing protein n=1 Tax=Dorcoceras hygrometricum TaxID=472368 RepID=A0A2Z7AAJ7_9LAMI|nr:hypothetical protein F511_14346 [Dorcoceras hygrometricum]